jgi:hypothetical protein
MKNLSLKPSYGSRRAQIFALAATVTYFHRFFDADEFFRRVQFLQTGLLHQEHE